MFFKGKETFVDLWRLYDFMRPILKHGANDSDACASLRVIEILRYNESEQVIPPRRRVIDGLKVFLSSIVGIYLFIFCLSLVVITKKMKMDRKKKFDQLIAKRFENIREKIKQREIKRKTMRKSKRVQQAMNHGEFYLFPTKIHPSCGIIHFKSNRHSRSRFLFFSFFG